MLSLLSLLLTWVPQPAGQDHGHWNRVHELESSVRSLTVGHKVAMWHLLDLVTVLFS